MTEWKAESVLEAEALDAIDLTELSDGKLEALQDRVGAEQERRWRKREKQAVRDAMNLNTEGEK